MKMEVKVVVLMGQAILKMKVAKLVALEEAVPQVQVLAAAQVQVLAAAPVEVLVAALEVDLEVDLEMEVLVQMQEAAQVQLLVELVAAQV